MSADAAEGGARDERNYAQRDVEPLADWVEPAADGLLRAEVDGLDRGALLHDVEVHDSGETRAKRAYVDGHHVHPVAGPGLYEQRRGKADYVHDDDRRHAGELCLFLKEGHRRLVEVDNARQSGEEHGYEEEYADDEAEAAHAVEHARQGYEHQAGAALGDGGARRGHGRDNDEGGDDGADRVPERDVEGGRGDGHVAVQV